ncbi:hypothetical protein N665_0413s0039 [Sinapis alba]|nr:hypothetical protein N665_0413s0039 [Sinapis alba]
MEGVGGRLGRSSTRYGGGPATVFTGPVRKWKKKWVHVSPSSSKKHTTSSSSASDGSHLLFFKWAPLSQGGNGNNEDGKSETNSPTSEEPMSAAEEEPPRRRFKYVPIALLEEQKQEATEIEEDDKVEVEVEDDEDANAERKKAQVEEKLDMNDVPMEDNHQEEDKVVRQDLNESTTDLGLNLNADSDNNPKGAAETLDEE